MIARSLNWLAAVGAVISMTAGCVVTTGGGTTVPAYERCNPGDFCGSGTTCASSNAVVAGMTQGNHCTNSCVGAGPNTGCVSVGGILGICVNDTAGNGQCFEGCARGPSDCGPGFTCAVPAGTAEAVCIPNGSGGTACGGSSMACCAGNACTAGLACSGGVCVAPPACGGINMACCVGNACEAGLACDGTRCVAPPACGAIGQACCTGAACVAGAVCGAGNVCAAAPPPPGPYEGCAPLGATCTGGTTCVQPRIANPEPSYGFCSRDCNSLASECPNSPIAGRPYNCYILTAGTAGQCFVDCAGGDLTCPTGTVCTMTTGATGASIRLCMPCPAGMCP